MATIPVTTIKQTAKAYTYCSHTGGKVQVWLQSWLPRCAEWNSQLWTPSSGGDSSCPRPKGHTSNTVTDIKQATELPGILGHMITLTDFIHFNGCQIQYTVVYKDGHHVIVQGIVPDGIMHREIGIHCNMDCILMATVLAHVGIRFYIAMDIMQDTQIYGITGYIIKNIG